VSNRAAAYRGSYEDRYQTVKGKIMNSFLKKAASAVLAAGLIMMAAIVLNSPTAISGTLSAGADDGIFKAKCAPCHGADGSGNTAMGKKLSVRDMRSAEVQGQSDAQLYSLIAKGKGKMPAYAKSLSQQQIQQLVAYIRQIGKKH
jgi:mono/diheme cytochrome c family protein